MTASPRNAASSPKPGQYALYRFYGADEELLYVGISNEPWRRRKQHMMSKPWYPQVKHQTITWYDSEALARLAEIRAIRGEHPQHNIAGAIRPPSPWLRLPAGVCINVALIWPGCDLTAAMLAKAFPVLRVVLYPLVDALTLGALPVMAVCCLVAFAPDVKRFAYWLERRSVR